MHNKKETIKVNKLIQNQIAIFGLLDETFLNRKATKLEVKLLNNTQKK